MKSTPFLLIALSALNFGCSVSEEECFPVGRTIRLHNGVQLPSLVLGSSQLILDSASEDKSLPSSFVGLLPERCYRTMETALQLDLRAFDTVSL